MTMSGPSNNYFKKLIELHAHEERISNTEKEELLDTLKETPGEEGNPEHWLPIQVAITTCVNKPRRAPERNRKEGSAAKGVNTCRK